MSAPATDNSELGRLISSIATGDVTGAINTVVQSAGHVSDSVFVAMLRTAALQPELTMLQCRQLHNAYLNAGKPDLKPNVTRRNIMLLSDSTVEGFIPLIELFTAISGVQASMSLPVFDSVEMDALNPESSLYADPFDIIIVSLSAAWLRRYLGSGPVILRQDVDRAKSMINTIIHAVTSHTQSAVIVTNFHSGAWPLPGGYIVTDAHVGYRQAVVGINSWLTTFHSDRVSICDIETALWMAGGTDAIGDISYFRAKIPYEPAGVVAVCREMASIIADTCGKRHRALITDLDNTVWGGVVAEAGFDGVISDKHTPDGQMYHALQNYMKHLKKIGVLLACASRNDPSKAEIFNESDDVLLNTNDFASMQISFNPKSAGISQIAAELNFGTEFMVFVDDSVFELAEVIMSHLFIDIIPAGPDPIRTLRRLTYSRLFNTASLTETDQKRHDQIRALQTQRRMETEAVTIDDFLRSIDIQITVSRLNEKNIRRIAQMFQKSNQFNLTTRRHTAEDLRRMSDSGYIIAAFHYKDTLMDQGIIAAIILKPDDAAVEIESWVMSCRVLNRTVEQAVFAWVLSQAGDRPIRGTYIPTAKNGLVENLYKNLGFKLFDNTDESTLWLYDPTQNVPENRHFATIITA